MVRPERPARKDRHKPDGERIARVFGRRPKYARGTNRYYLSSRLRPRGSYLTPPPDTHTHGFPIFETIYARVEQFRCTVFVARRTPLVPSTRPSTSGKRSVPINTPKTREGRHRRMLRSTMNNSDQSRRRRMCEPFTVPYAVVRPRFRFFRPPADYYYYLRMFASMFRYRARVVGKRY